MVARGAAESREQTAAAAGPKPTAHRAAAPSVNFLNLHAGAAGAGV